MHPAYTEEKTAAGEMARAGESVLTISANLRRDFDVSVYVADTIARVAFDVTRAEWVVEARKRGTDAAEAAASWTADGNTSADHVRRVLAMLDAGDPAADEFLPRRPDLSGELADEPNPVTLAREVTGEPWSDSDVIEALADAFEAGVDDRFEAACEEELRRHV